MRSDACDCHHSRDHQHYPDAHWSAASYGRRHRRCANAGYFPAHVGSVEASSLGAGCVLLSVAVSAADIAVTVRALAGLLFLLLTAPVAAHMIGRAAYMIGAPLWKGTMVDELKGHYDTRRHTLSGIGAQPVQPRRGTGPLGDKS